MYVAHKATYLGMWGETLRVLRRHKANLLKTVALASIGFILSGLASANHMIVLGNAAMNGIEIPMEVMDLLFLTLVAGDCAAYILLAIGASVIALRITSENANSYRNCLRTQLRGLLRSIGFWIYLLLQPVIFACVNTPETIPKLSGIAAIGISMLLLITSQDKTAPSYGSRRRQLDAKAWVSLIVAIPTFVALYILTNGYLNYLVLMVIDQGALQVVHLFAPGSPFLPFTVIIISKFITLSVNVILLAFVVGTALTLRGSPTTPVTSVAARQDELAAATS